MISGRQSSISASNVNGNPMTASLNSDLVDPITKTIKSEKSTPTTDRKQNYNPHISPPPEKRISTPASTHLGFDPKKSSLGSLSPKTMNGSSSTQLARRMIKNAHNNKDQNAGVKNQHDKTETHSVDGTTYPSDLQASQSVIITSNSSSSQQKFKESSYVFDGQQTRSSTNLNHSCLEQKENGVRKIVEKTPEQAPKNNNSGSRKSQKNPSHRPLVHELSCNGMKLNCGSGTSEGNINTLTSNINDSIKYVELEKMNLSLSPNKNPRRQKLKEAANDESTSTRIPENASQSIGSPRLGATQEKRPGYPSSGYSSQISSRHVLGQVWKWCVLLFFFQKESSKKVRNNRSNPSLEAYNPLANSR